MQFFIRSNKFCGVRSDRKRYFTVFESVPAWVRTSSVLSNQAIILTEFSRRGRAQFVNRYAAVYCEVANRNIAGSRQFATRVFPLPRVVSFLTQLYSYWLPHNTLRHIYLRNWALLLLENSVNIIVWLLSTLGVRTHVGTDSKTVKYRLWSLRTPQNLFDRMKNCIERVKLSSGFAVMVFVFAGSVFTARYFRLNKGTCRRSYLPCPLFIQVPHVP